MSFHHVLYVLLDACRNLLAESRRHFGSNDLLEHSVSSNELALLGAVDLTADDETWLLQI